MYKMLTSQKYFTTVSTYRFSHVEKKSPRVLFHGTQSSTQGGNSCKAIFNL